MEQQDNEQKDLLRRQKGEAVIDSIVSSAQRIVDIYSTAIPNAHLLGKRIFRNHNTHNRRIRVMKRMAVVEQAGKNVAAVLKAYTCAFEINAIESAPLPNYEKGGI